MVDNPMSAALAHRDVARPTTLKDYAKCLTAENKKLESQLHELRAEHKAASEERAGGGSDGFLGAAAGGASSLDSSKVNTRLKEIFKEKIAHYREAVYLLTGFKVDLVAEEGSMAGSNKLRLRSVYAEQADDALLFRWKDSNAALELLATPFVNDRVDKKILDFLRSSNSIPVFLANVTVDLFEKQTVLG